MRKFLISIISIFIGFSAYCAGENVTTSKSYVDSALVPKQDIIEGTNDSPRVLTNTGTAGEYGTKEIYNSTNAYGTQQDALIDAATMNAAVQNAIDSEFQCIEWGNPNDHTSDCLLMEIRGVTGKSTLPNGYTALEYIENQSGTAHIQTGRYITNTPEWHVTAQGIGDVTGTQVILGYNQDWLGCFVGVCSNGYFCADPQGNSTRLSTEKTTFTAIFTIEGGKNKAQMIIDGVTYTSRILNARSYNIPVHLFHGNLYDGAIFRGKIFNVMAYNTSHELVWNGIPARRNSDGEIGMYDMVSRTFFEKSGTGEFIAGPVANLYLPSAQ